MTPAEKPRRLGRGLEALIAAAAPPPAAPAAPVAPAPAEPTSALRDLPIAAIHPNPFQPRRSFNPEELQELEASLRATGLLQPITVRQVAEGTYQLVAGERRLRAATRIGWTDIPAIVKEFDDRDMLVLAMVENLQRSDLNPIDEALGYERLTRDFGHTQQQVADAVGKDRSTIANFLRLLTLPEGIRKLVRDGQLTLGHARALLALPNERAMLEAARRVVDEGLSVRQVERLTHESRPAPTTGKPAAAPAPRGASAQDAELRRITELLRRRLQTDVRIDIQAGSRGAVMLNFYSADDLHRLVELVLGSSLDDA
ncbi:MAG: ParB/RepB/Spo0J family partition protein [Gemmatimonadetes bacterium]|nr:ParB/RepB/Spo0J family partition protein [Gemmatimonadota bacterium]